MGTRRSTATLVMVVSIGVLVLGCTDDADLSGAEVGDEGGATSTTAVVEDDPATAAERDRRLEIDSSGLFATFRLARPRSDEVTRTDS